MHALGGWPTLLEDDGHGSYQRLCCGRHLCTVATPLERKCQERLDPDRCVGRSSRFFLPRDHSEQGARDGGWALPAKPQTLRNPSCCGPVAMW